MGDRKCYLKIYNPEKCPECKGYDNECHKRNEFELELIRESLNRLEKKIREDSLGV